MTSITRKNRLRYDIARYRKQIDENPSDPRVTEYREYLQKLEERLPNAELDFEKAKERSIEAERRYGDLLVEHRIEAMPEARREEARALLTEEREAIHRLALSPTISGGDFGAAGGKFFGIELRMEAARAKGDETAVQSLLPALEEARRGKEQAEALMERQNERIAALRDEYAERLLKLAEP